MDAHGEEDRYMTREPAVAGQFYPGNRAELQAMIERFTPQDVDARSVPGALTPHAGYVFCGGVMGRVFARVEVPETVLILNPGHRARRPAVALWPDEPWETPLGEVQLDTDLCDGLAELSMVSEDRRAHEGEHAGEVVLPFLQYHRPDVSVAVACITPEADLDDLMELGDSVAELAGEDDDLLVVASSDMSHESGPDALEVVKQNDPKAIEKMEELDPEGLVEVCRTEDITMCGVLPAAVMMRSVRKRGGRAGTLLERATSADSPYGSPGYVVGYAGMTFE
jgi:hypothetical protein